MAKCIRCGNDNYNGRRICSSCLGKWTDMRSAIFDELQKKYGKLSPTNHPTFIKETKRLEKIWRKDKDAFAVELGKINPAEV